MIKRRQMLGLLAACALAFTGSFTGYADPVTYDTTSNASYGGQQFNFEAGTPKLYPGDKVYGASAIYLGADNAQAGKAESQSKADDGTSLWKNGTAAVYTVKDLTPAADTAQTEMVPLTDENGNPVTNEDGTQAMVPKQADQQPAGKVYQLDTAGYVVEAIGGTLSGSGDTDPSASALTVTGSDGSQQTATPDAKYFAEGTQVTVTADAAPDGQQFAGWSVSKIGADGSVQTADDISALGLSGLSADALKNASLTFTMGKPDQVVVFAARYEAAQKETEQPATEAPAADQPQTDAAGQDASQSINVEGGAATEDAGNAAAPADSSDASFAPADGQQAQSFNVSVTFVTDDGSDSTIVTPYSDGFSQAINTQAENSKGQVFDKWTASDPAVQFSDPTSASSTVTFAAAPSADVAIQAVYKDAPAAPAQTETTAESDAQNTSDQPETKATEAPQAETKATEAPQETASLLTVNLEGAENPAAVSLQNEADNSKIEAGTKVPEGTLVTATVEGVEKSSDVSVTTSDGTAVQTKENGDAGSQNVSVTFTMPAEETTVNVADQKPDDEHTRTLTVKKDDNGASHYTKVTVTDKDGNPIQDQTKLQKGQIIVVKAENSSASPVVTVTGADGSKIDITDAGGQTFTFTMPDQDVTVNVTAPDDKTYKVSVTVTGGVITSDNNNASGAYLAGTSLAVKADDAPAGKVFDGWTFSDQSLLKEVPGDLTQAALSFELKSPLTASANLTVTANYKDIMYNLTVTSGSGTGQYAASTPAAITADAPKEGYRFSGWTIASGTGTFADQKAATTTFTCSSDASVQANYEPIPYKITVKNGKPSGTYTIGQKVSLQADYPAAGKEFDKWTVTSGKIELGDKSSFYSTATVKASDATITAVYKNGPDPANNTISGLQNDMEYLKSSTLTFNAVGVGMDNTNPNPGDYRYRPTGYQIGSVTGSWTEAPYQTSMAINAVGDYTLTVTYAKDVYDGNTWKADGTTDQKSITIHVVNTLSVKTGDTSPIIPLAIVAAAALAAIILLVVIRKKNRK
ncbi:InlB B-repeat-containing protein [Porcincola sp. LCP21S3_C12]|uniref:InlB B-repeat-containing protein n=1 Tax=Porcincola sp. LCP21S3_C12 TaxID=3438798 RepID=UPI003F975C4B